MASSCDTSVVDGFISSLNFSDYFPFENEFILSLFLCNKYFIFREFVYTSSGTSLTCRRFFWSFFMLGVKFSVSTTT